MGVGKGFGLSWVGGAEDAQALVSAYHTLLRRNASSRVFHQLQIRTVHLGLCIPVSRPYVAP